MEQTIGHARTWRLVDAKLFERLCLRSVAPCSEHALIDRTRPSVDGFQIAADAALASLRAGLAAVDADAPGAAAVEGDAADGEGDGGGDRDASAEAPGPRLRPVAPRTGATPKRRGSNATSLSRSDPDAKLRHRPGRRPRLVHRGEVAVDPQGAVRGRVRG